MNKKLISEIAKKDSSFFNVYEFNNSYAVTLNKEFRDCFSEEINSTTDFFINEVKKEFGEKIPIHLKNNIVIIKKNTMKINEAEYKGKDVKLNKPMRGDVKKYKVFVKNPKTGNVKKVNFGDKNMEIKRDNPERRKSFRARHKCDTAKDKTKPRYWSCKFWSKKSVSDLLNEIVEPDNVDVSNFELKDDLNKKIFIDSKLDDQVRKVLLKNAIEFIKFCKIQHLNYKDIILTGSMANYNYTDESDIDLHILMDFNQISDDKEFVGEYFRNKKKIWEQNYPSKIKGHDIELYVQDTSEPHVSTGVYSLMNDEWLTNPTKKVIALDTANIQLKSAHIMNLIDDLVETKNNIDIVDDIDNLLNKLKKMRKCGLEKEGEFSTENIVFKILRNNGYIEKLMDLKKNYLTKQLTLEHTDLNENKFTDILRKYKNAGLLSIGMVVAALASGISSDEIKKIGVDDNVIKQAQKYVSDEFSNIKNINLLNQK